MKAVPCPGWSLAHDHITGTEGEPAYGWPSHLVKKMHREDMAGCRDNTRPDVLWYYTQTIGSPEP